MGQHTSVPRLDGVEYYLRPVVPGDYETLRMIELHPETIHTYRHYGRTPSSEAFVAGLQGVELSFSLCRKRDHQVSGSAIAYSADYRNGHIWVSCIAAPEHRGPGALNAFQLFLDYVFAMWPFRKIYFDVLDVNRHALASLVGYMWQTEAHFRDDVYVLGELQDRFVFAVWRETWAALMGRDGSTSERLAIRFVESLAGD